MSDSFWLSPVWLLGVRRNGFHDVDETLPKRAFVEVLQRNLGLVVVPVGLDEPEETPDELAADNVDMEPFDDSGFRKKIKKSSSDTIDSIEISGSYCTVEYGRVVDIFRNGTIKFEILITALIEN
uniref:Uncharacterized protein n=1 Tax=Glossina austeni TaxID=7395 RepID=A0A1A9UT27_GLOAU